MTAKTPLVDKAVKEGGLAPYTYIDLARDLERQLSVQIAATKSVLEMNEALCKERDALRDRLAEFEQVATAQLLNKGGTGEFVNVEWTHPPQDTDEIILYARKQVASDGRRY